MRVAKTMFLGWSANVAVWSGNVAVLSPKVAAAKNDIFSGTCFFYTDPPMRLQLSTPTTQWGDMVEIPQEFSICHILAGTANNPPNWLQAAPTIQVSRTTLGGAS